MQNGEKKLYEKCTIQFHAAGTEEYNRLKNLLEQEQLKEKNENGEHHGAL